MPAAVTAFLTVPPSRMSVFYFLLCFGLMCWGSCEMRAVFKEVMNI